MKVPEPTFELFQEVTLHWNGHDYPQRVVQRLFDPDKEQWFYQINSKQIQLVTISNLSAR
jgi:hypothetical protein